MKHHMIYVTIILLTICITVFTLDTWQMGCMICLFSICVSYLVILGMNNVLSWDVTHIAQGYVKKSNGYLKEGFTSNESDATQSKYDWLTQDDLFDDFYASVFTKLTQHENLIQAEASICLEEFAKNKPKSACHILDAACGTGIATCTFKKQKVGSVVGIDKSHAMIRYAKGTLLPSTTLTDTEKQDIEFRTFDLHGPGAASPAEFTDACLLYFSIYYFRDLDALFRNLALWVKPGGNLVVEVVNKYKFDPILDSSNPWVGISPQKYAKERLTTSKVVFDKFDYEAVFELDDPKAEFRETFRFKDGSVRRQKHHLYMPSIPDIVKKAQQNGWLYTKYVDLMPLSFQYGYLLFFTHS